MQNERRQSTLSASVDALFTRKAAKRRQTTSIATADVDSIATECHLFAEGSSDDFEQLRFCDKITSFGALSFSILGLRFDGKSLLEVSEARKPQNFMSSHELKSHCNNMHTCKFALKSPEK